MTCLACDKPFDVVTSIVGVRETCSKDCWSIIHGQRLSGDKSNFWRGGITKMHDSIRNSAAMGRWRSAVFQRDNFTCVECGVTNVLLNADHIKPFAYFPELRFDLSNGRTMCVPCHKATDTYGRKAQILYGKVVLNA